MLAKLKKFLTKLFKNKPKGKIVFENYDKRNLLINIVEFAEFDNQEINNFFEELEHYNQSGIRVETDEDIIIRLFRPRNFRVDSTWLLDCSKIFINRQNNEILFNCKEQRGNVFLDYQDGGVVPFNIEKIKEIVIE